MTMADLEPLAAEQARLKELHAAFAAKLDKDLALHKEKCAEQDFELRVRERFAADKLKLAIELDAALKERTIALDRKEQAHNEKHAKVREAAAAIILEMEAEALRWKLKPPPAQKLPRANGEN
jgi:hypothetical protein